MSKAVLVIDMPKDGLSCKAGYYDDEQDVVHCPIMDCVCDGWKVPDWCPLIPEPAYYGMEKWERDGYKGGWNDALDQIGLSYEKEDKLSDEYICLDTHKPVNEDEKSLNH